MIIPTCGELYDRCVTYYGNREACVYGNQRLTYREIKQRAYSLANGLLDMGLKKGSRVAFLMPNCPEYIICEYALYKAGLVRVPLAVLLSAKDHIYMLKETEAEVLIYHERMINRVKGMLPELKTVRHFICISENPDKVMEGHHCLQTFFSAYSSSDPEIEVEVEDMAAIYYTGGTTGLPKGAMHRHRSIAAANILEMLEFGLEAKEVFAYLTPLTHASGFLLLPVFLKGGRGVIFDHFDVKDFLEVLEKEKITSTFLVPTMIYMLLDYPELKKYDFSSLRNIIYGASVIAPERLKQAIDIFGPIFTQLYGQVEAPMTISVLRRDEHILNDPEKEKRVFASCGRPMTMTQVRIVQENDQDVPVGEVGEVIVRGNQVMEGYLKKPELTVETLRGGWLHTGDLARWDEEGFLYIVDRKKDMIISGGFNIYPREIEDVLHEHPSVRDVCVIGVPHEKWGEEVKAIVVLYKDKPVTEEELIKFVKEKKGSLAAPKTVEFWESIPLTNLGKHDKKAIRERYWKGKERMVH